MSQIPTRTLRDYFNSLANGVVTGVVGQNLNIASGFAPADQAVPPGGATGQVLTKTNGTDFAYDWADTGNGDMLKSVYDPQGINADAFDRANQTGTQPASTITGLADVATSGDYSDLTGIPTLGALASKDEIAVPGDIDATGTPNSATFLRGDGQWVIPPAGLKDDIVVYNPSGFISPGRYPIVLYSINAETYTRLRIGVYDGGGSCRVTLEMNGNTVTTPVVVTEGTVYSGTISLSVPMSGVVSVLIDSIDSVSAMYVQIDGNT